MNPLTALDISSLSVIREGRSILDNLNLCLEEGDAALLTGPNGCGKTTLLRTIAGFLKQGTGSITLFGEDSTNKRWKLKRHLLAYIAQEEQSHTFPLTVEEMVEMGTAGLWLGHAERQEKIDISLEYTGCLNLRKRYFFALSGGEKRRTSLARCLCQDARLLLLDEPLTYLDKESRERFLLVLENIRSKLGITILMVSHTEENLRDKGWIGYKMLEGEVVKYA